MATFNLKDIDDRQWGTIATRAQLAGWPLRALALQLLDDFAAGRITPSQPPPMDPAPVQGDAVVLRFTCPKCNKSMKVLVKHVPGFGYMQFHAVECPHCHAVTERMLPADILDIEA
jgi:hypothetical protein